MSDRHHLRRLGAEHHRRVTVENPCLIGAYSLFFRGTVMVEDSHEAINSSATPGMLNIIAIAPHKDVNTFVLSPHGGNPGL